MGAIREAAKHGVGAAAVAAITAARGNVDLVHHAVDAARVSIPRDDWHRFAA